MGTEVGSARGQPSERSETICPMERSGMGCGQAPVSGVLPPWAETVQVGAFVRRRACSLATNTGVGPFVRRRRGGPSGRGPAKRGGLRPGERRAKPVELDR